MFILAGTVYGGDLKHARKSTKPLRGQMLWVEMAINKKQSLKAFLCSHEKYQIFFYASKQTLLLEKVFLYSVDSYKED